MESSIRPHLEAVEHIIWDWNGTLLNNVHLCVEVISGLLEEHGLPTISRDEYRAKFRFPVKTYYEGLGFDFGERPFEVVADMFIERYSARVLECSLFEGAQQTIQELQQQGYSQCILSAAKEHHLHDQIEHYGIKGFLETACGLSDHYAAGKVERGVEMLDALNWKRDTTLLIGDTEHDQEVAESLGVKCLLLADGHQDYSRLLKTGAPIVESR